MGLERPMKEGRGRESTKRRGEVEEKRVKKKGEKREKGRKIYRKK